MNYSEARAFIERISARGSELGLTSITNLLSVLGNPQDELKFVHVAGTNGKGSVLAYLASVLKKAGLYVGRYISPTLFSYRERIQINGEYISREDFAVLATEVSDAMQEMEKRGMALPTVFEVETAISFLYFRKMKCDLVLLEVGMGGRLDATNIIKTPVLTVLASISMDHMEFLGNTLAEIAWNKAGIMKNGIPCVSAVQAEEAVPVIKEEAAKLGCRCLFADMSKVSDISYGLTEQSFVYEGIGEIVIHLAGLHQIDNAVLALTALSVLREIGYEISDEAIRTGMAETVWRGRFTPICEKPTVIMDGAHNPDAAMRLREAVQTYFPDRKKYFIFGVFSDKEYGKIINSTAPLADHIIAIETPDNPRALPVQELVKAVSAVNPSVEAADSIEDAVARAFSLAGREDVILIFGSLSFLGRVEQAVLRTSKDNK